MEIIAFENGKLLPILSLVSNIVPQKNTMSILSCVRFETKKSANGEDYLDIMACDTNNWLRMSAPLVSGGDNIQICVEAKSLLQPLRSLGDKVVTMEIDQEKRMLNCVYENGHFGLPFEDAKDFPMPNTNLEDAKEMNIQGIKMQTAIDRVKFGIAQDPIRQIINGVHFEFTQNNMCAVTTDSFKFVRYMDGDVKNDSGQDDVLNMPEKPAMLLLNLLSEIGENVVNIKFNDNAMIINNDYFFLCSRLLEGAYPMYKPLIPVEESTDINIVLEKEKVNDALKRVSTMSNSLSELIVLKLTQGNFAITTEDIDFSRNACENIPCDYQGEEFSIGFKSSTLQQTIQNIKGEHVHLIMKVPNRPGVFKEDTIEGLSDYLSILMPMVEDFN